MRLIDADAIVTVQMFDVEHEEYKPTKMTVGEYLDNFADGCPPTVEPKRGRWEGDETCDAYDIAGVKTWAVKRKCSVCGFVHKFIEAHTGQYVYCPNCGAAMKGDEDG